MSLDTESHWDAWQDDEREPGPRNTRTSKLDARGSVRIHYVCPSDVHEAMKQDGRFEQLPYANEARPYQLLERYEDEPAGLLEVRNCSCGSTICKVVAEDTAPDWQQVLRTAGLI